MNKDEYKKLVDKITPKENKFKNFMVAFLVGGSIGMLGEVIINLLTTAFGVSVTESYMWLCMIIIFVGSFLTALGIFDNFVSKAKCGLIVPTTGFAHSIASSALDYKKDGLITGVGANFFRLAGSVILYGIISGFIFGIIKVIINV